MDGFTVGLACGVAAGVACGISHTRNELLKLIRSGTIRVVDEDGADVDEDLIIERLTKRPPKK